MSQVILAKARLSIKALGYFALDITDISSELSGETDDAAGDVAAELA